MSVDFLVLTNFSCLRNAVALFHVLEKELAWRKENGKPEGFESLRAYKPIVAVGAEHPLEDDELAADYFREEHRVPNAISNTNEQRWPRWSARRP